MKKLRHDRPVKVQQLWIGLHEDLKTQRKISAFFAAVAVAEGFLILCFGIGQLISGG